MGEIKSTLEIVMEKTKALKITSEEKTKFKRREMEGRIKGLVQKFLDSFLSLDTFKMEIAAIGKGQEDILRQIITEESASRIKLKENNDPIFKILDSITGIDTSPAKKVLADFEHRFEKYRSAHEKRLGKELREKGIFGSAVIPNLNTDWKWNNRSSELKETFQKQIERSIR